MTALTFDNNIKYTSSSYISMSAYAVDWYNSLSERYASSSASISLSVDDVLSFLISEDIVLENANRVKDFLRNNYGVVACLYETPGKIKEYFGESKLQVGIFSDPDSNNELQELYIEVGTLLSPEEANEKLSKINRNWLLISGDQDLMSLNVTLKFL